MTVRQVAAAHYREQRAMAVALEQRAARAWSGMDPANLDRSWTAIGEQLFVEVSSAQLLAASTAQSYVAAALAQQGVTDPRDDGQVQARAFAGIASDGRDLEPLLYSSVTRTKEAIDSGASPADALTAGGNWLTTLVNTQVADLGRSAVVTAITGARSTTGWVRMTSGTSCARCAILAGRFYRTNQGFDRHPKCDCVHVPAAESDGVDDVRTDPGAYFRSLSPADQDRVFTQAGAQAIRDGADIGQVVNARRGARGLSQPGRLTADEQRMLRGGRDRGRLERVDVYGRPVFITSEGVTTRGIAGKRLGASETGEKAKGARYRSARTPRLMPESIYDLAGGDRDEAIRLLRRFGYIT